MGEGSEREGERRRERNIDVTELKGRLRNEASRQEAIESVDIEIRRHCFCKETKKQIPRQGCHRNTF